MNLDVPQLKTEVTYNFAGEVQDDILRLCAKDRRIAAVAPTLIQPGYFRDQSRQWVIRKVIEFQGKYQMPPSHGQINTELNRDFMQGKVNQSEAAEIFDLNDRIYKQESHGSQQYTVDLVQEFAQHRAWEKAIEQAGPLLERGAYDAVNRIMQNAARVSLPIDDGVYWYFESAAERIRRRGTEDDTSLVIPTGIMEADMLMRKGGVGAGQVCMWLADKGGGKSLALCQVARRAVFAGYKVIYFSFEMSEDEIADRQDAGFTYVDMDDLETEREHLLRQFEELEQAYGKSFAIKRYPTKQFTIEAMRSCLETLRFNDGWSPDLIILDYVSIVKPRRLQDRHLEIQEIVEDFRALCIDYGAAGHTANQLNRGAAAQKIARGSSAAGSFDQLASVDMCFVINMSDLDRINEVLSLWVEKIRDGIDKVLIENLKTCFKRMQFVMASNLTKDQVLEIRRQQQLQMIKEAEEEKAERKRSRNSK